MTTPTLTELLRLPEGPVDLRSYDARDTPGFDGDMGNLTGRIEALNTRHAMLEDQLVELLKRPSVTTAEIAAIAS